MNRLKLRFSKTRGRTLAPDIVASSGGSARTSRRDPPDVASNLRRLRQQRGHSLETLARLSGVSRAMLGQIETGKSAPTINLLWKIAKALDVELGELISSPEPSPPVVLRGDQLRTSKLSDGRYETRIYAQPVCTLSYEASELRIAPRHSEQFAPLAHGLHATLIVSQGTLIVTVGGAISETLESGDAILFDASRTHSISNEGDISATAYLIIAPLRFVGSK